MPGPGAGEDVVELRVFGPPAEVGLRLRGAGDKAGGVAGAAGFDLDGDGVAGDAACGLDDLLHRKAGAVAEVVDHLFGLVERGECEDVGVGEVENVDVVANAGAVGSGVVVAEDEDLVTAAEGDVEYERDDVGLGLVSLAAVGQRAGDVEVAQRGVAQTVD